MISAHELQATHGTFRMQALSLEVRAGELLVILGPSGAGKTVLLESMMGLKQIESGRILIDGRDVTGLPPEERQVAYMPQDVALFPHLSVLDNILFGRRARRALVGAEAELERFSELLQIRPLLARKHIRTLSGGERQRVALARALMVSPRVLFLDESFSSLDAQIRRQLLLQLRELQQRLDLTVVYVTHSHLDAKLVGDRVAVLMAGCIVQVDSPDRLFRHPVDARVARFVEVDNLFPVDASGGGVCNVKGVCIKPEAPPLGPEGAQWLGIRAEDVVVLRPGEAERLGVLENRFRGRVTELDTRNERPRMRVTLDEGGGLELISELSARERLLGSEGWSVGDPLEVHLPPAALSAFPEETRRRAASA